MNKKQIDIAKSVNLLSVAMELGLNAKRQTSKGVFFENPFRSESEASFNIFRGNDGLFRAKDLGEALPAMDTISFIQRYRGMSFVDAVSYLIDFEGVEPNQYFSFSQQTHEYSQKIEIRTLIPHIRNKGLINYLKKRAINTEVLKKCGQLFECYYRIEGKTRANGKDYFCLAFQNADLGFDLRAENFKGKFGKNSYSLIENTKSNHVSVFEGFMDYLSALTYYGLETSNHNILILNSTENIKNASYRLAEFDRVYCFLDNDETGKKALGKINEICSNVVNKSDIYLNFNDFNDFLVNG